MEFKGYPQTARERRVPRDRFGFAGAVNFPLVTTLQIESVDWSSKHKLENGEKNKPDNSECPFAKAHPVDRCSTTQKRFVQETLQLAGRWPRQPIVYDPHLDTFQNIQGGFRRTL